MMASGSTQFILRRERQEDEDHRKSEDEDRSVAGLALLQSEFRPFEGRALRQDLTCKRFHLVEGAARRDARRGIALNGDRNIHVVALDERRSARIADFDERSERHQGARGGAYLEREYVLPLQPELLVGLGADLIDAAEGVEIVDVGRPQIDRERLEDIGDRDVQGPRLVAVDRQEELRAGGRECGEDAGQPLRLVGRSHHLIGEPERAAHVGALPVHDLHLEAARIADASHGGWRNGDDESLLNALHGTEDLADDLFSTLLLLEAFLEAVEGREDHAGIGCIGEGRAVETGKGDCILDAGYLADHLRGPPDDLIGALERGAVRKLNDDDGIALVHRGYEAAGHDLRHVPGGSEQGDEDEERPGQRDPRPDEVAHRPCIAIGHAVEAAVEAVGKPAAEPRQGLRLSWSWFSCGRNRIAASAGESVRELTAEITVATAIVTANCR